MSVQEADHQYRRFHHEIQKHVKAVMTHRAAWRRWVLKAASVDVPLLEIAEETRRMVLVERSSQREVARPTGLARETVARMVGADASPRWVRAPAAAKLDHLPGMGEQQWADPRIPWQRLREMATDLSVSRVENILRHLTRPLRAWQGVELIPAVCR